MLFLTGHPLDRLSLGVVSTLTSLIDLWVDDGRLPSSIREVSRQRGWGNAGEASRSAAP